MPILAAHRLDRYRHIYLARSHSPVAIRDQMVRACMMVDRAIERKIITDDRPLVVAGAGVAGASAALRAAAMGIRAYLVERAGVAFGTQLSSTRWIDPVQYDWPAGHWRAGELLPPPLPLSFHAGRADQLAATWAQELELGIQRSNGKLIFLPYHEADYTRPTNRVQAPFRVTIVPNSSAAGPGAKIRSVRAGMFLIATGLPAEKTVVDRFVGYRFWEPDQLSFKAPPYGIGSGSVRILISGGGDGALQDFLRSVITPDIASARELFSQITRFVPSALAKNLADAEDAAIRGYVWSPTTVHDHSILTRLDSAYAAAIRTIRDRHWTSITAVLRNLVRSELHSLVLIHRCEHFARCYGLNHFLAKLLIEYLSSVTSPKFTMIRNSEVVSVASLQRSHVCAAQPDLCHGEPHQIVVRAKDCHAAGIEYRRVPGSFNIVIVRHGVAREMYQTVTGDMQLPRQVLPYALPHDRPT